MFKKNLPYLPAITISLTIAALTPLFGQNKNTTAIASAQNADVLDGGYGRYRANNDLLFYHLDVRVGTKENRQIIKPTNEWKQLKTALKNPILRRRPIFTTLTSVLDLKTAFGVGNR